MSKITKDNKGFWEYSIFQKIIVPNEEQNIKYNLQSENSFNPKLIHDYINPQLSKPEQIYNKVINNKKINKSEQIIYDKYVKDNKILIDNDMKEIERKGKNAILKTKEGKIHLLMIIAELEIKKNNTEMIAKIYMKLMDTELKMNDELKNKYKHILDTINKIVQDIDLIELQFTKLSSYMPPLNEKKFVKFDEWQINVINNIDNNVSTIVSAPTSSGKTVLSSYSVLKGRILYIVPTDALAWQVASNLTKITNSDVPIITLTYQSIPKRDELIKKINISQAIVGTADSILDYLPCININFKWIIYDEIHMIGREEGFAMESIAKILHNIPFLALSATINNIDYLKEWFNKITNNPVDTIICNKRFFNLQKYYFDKDIKMINPLSMVCINEFEDGSIKNKNLDPTPQDTWSLVTKLLNYNIELNDLNPYIYFEKTERIELYKAIKYFKDLIDFLSDNYNLYKNIIQDLLKDYSHFNIKQNINLIDLMFKINEEHKSPTIIFQHNTIACLKIARRISNDIDNLEAAKYPNLYNERLKIEKQNKRIIKKNDKIENSLTEKQEIKKMLDNKLDNKLSEQLNIDKLNAPHNDFVFSKEKITDIMIEEYNEKFKIFFPFINGDYHFLIKLLWRGIGVYVIGLPDGYLRLIQSLANKKKLAFVFSDISLVFGVSMPFRSVVIYKNNNIVDNLDTMIYRQMEGRAGRRCLDKEGHIIFAGYSWDRIKELSSSSIPSINGINKPIYTFLNANNLCNNKQNYLLINQNLLSNQNYEQLNNDIISNYDTLWNNNKSIDYNHNYLLWMMRYSYDSIIIIDIIPYIERYYSNIDPNKENNQVELAFLLSNFIDIKYTSNRYNYLSKFNDLYKKLNINEIKNNLLTKNITINDNIDCRIWVSIRNNLLVDVDDEILRQELFNFKIKIRSIQHYFFHKKQINVAKLLGKLLTRIWWIYHSSSPVIKLT
jgi:5'-deoxynucleotidase YfbR-like HD superfamily hydrolase